MASILVGVILVLLAHADGTHFRGAMFWWTASQDDPRKVDISFRVSWRRTYRESTFCNLTTINQKTLIGPPDAGDVLCVSGCYNRQQVVGDMKYFCTDYSQVENWSSGERTYSYAFPATGQYKLVWKGKGWVEGLQQGRDAPWEFAMYLDLQIRSDTSRTNSSPRTAMTTITSLQQGCHHRITIPREDPDGDPVFCRWADPMRGECGGICAHDPDIQLNKVRCELSFPPTAPLGWYALAVQLEDFRTGSVVPLSSVPLQFLVQVYQSTAACDALPVFIPPTPEDGTCLLPVIGRTMWFLIMVRTKDRATTIIDVTTTSTDGMQKTLVRHTPDTSDYYVNVTWTPRERREHILCFTATDSARVSTPQRCVYLAVNPTRPEALSALLSEDKRTIIISFDQNVFLPYTSHYIWVYNEQSKTVLFMEDTSRSPRLTTVDNTLHVQLPTYVVFIDSIYVIMESGAVRGMARCAESVAVSDIGRLSLNTGVTPRPINTASPGIDTSSVLPPTSFPTTKFPPTQGTSDEQTSNGIPTGITPAAKLSQGRDYTWLIVLILGTVLLIAAAILIAVAIKKGPGAFSKRPLTGASRGTGAAPAPARHRDFTDINVKYR